MVRRCVLFVVVALILGSGVGLAQPNNCGAVQADITGWLELFGPTQDIWRDPPVLSVPVREFMTRMPVVQ